MLVYTISTSLNYIKTHFLIWRKRMNKYTVWVGGTEVTDSYVGYSKAIDILKIYEEKGYTDVVIQANKKGEKNEKENLWSTM